ncbi:trehalose-phosphatase [Microbacterium sp. No. 7]|uniref:trehalose-phosphatase n=1 Tax=Microbacterium sp. No. 7 TaxID=1714373 RepID=UPI0006D107A6|nr:trehalose-phosphatase [Microbacterium sp. No. 7]ALJ20046.1 trehalose phosphatase [Microbacterium sp. No. 7]
MTLDALVTTPVLLVALDFDGTLSPLVDEPMSARMAPAARRAVDALLAVPDTRVAFVSGRSLADLRVIAEHDDDARELLAGSHGAEFWMPGAGASADTDEAATALRDALRARIAAEISGVPGAWIETKTFGLALHTRLADGALAPRARDAVDAVMAEAAPHWRRREGHDVVEFSHRAEGKDAAIARLRAETGASAVLFAGDDVTDEDAIRSLGPGDVGVRVGPGETAAAVRVDDIDALARLLTGLAHERAAARE